MPFMSSQLWAVKPAGNSNAGCAPPSGAASHKSKDPLNTLFFKTTPPYFYWVTAVLHSSKGICILLIHCTTLGGLVFGVVCFSFGFIYFFLKLFNVE